MPGLHIALLSNQYIDQVMHISRTKVSTGILYDSKYLLQFYLDLFPDVSFSFDEPIMEEVACLEKDNDADEQEDEEVV